MKASKIKLSFLKTLDDHLEAINDIESDYVNSYGGLDRWLSGHTTSLKTNAQNKIDKINARIDRLFCNDNDDDAC